VILGSGPGGHVAAIRAAQLGNTVAVVEEKYWGGVCLSVGCIPSKALLRNAEMAHLVNSEAKPSGIHVDGTVRFDHAAAFRRSRKVADGRVRGVHLLMKKNGITELTGHGTFLDPRTLRVDLTDGGTETVTFANAIVAAGVTIRPGPGHRVVAGADLGPAMGPGCE
jgi:dihydrolipoamide dehydrogenase